MPPHEMVAGGSWQVEFGIVICEQKCSESSEGMMTISIYKCEVLEDPCREATLHFLSVGGPGQGGRHELLQVLAVFSRLAQRLTWMRYSR